MLNKKFIRGFFLFFSCDTESGILTRFSDEQYICRFLNNAMRIKTVPEPNAVGVYVIGQSPGIYSRIDSWAQKVTNSGSVEPEGLLSFSISWLDL